MRSLIKALSAVVLTGWGGAAFAQDCPPTAHRVQPGETIFTIAQQAYGDPEQWTLIYYANEAALKETVFQVRAGDLLLVPCLPGSKAADATPLKVEESEAELKLLTASNYEPFTDLDWPGQGMFTELVNASMESTPDQVTYSISWHNDWGDHFDLLTSQTYDMGFAWREPPCDLMPDNVRCKNFHFSDPLVEVPMMLFVRAERGLKYETDADIIGMRICRPDGYLSFDLDRQGREWLKRGEVTLVRAEDEPGCYEKLLAGEVDAVSLNVFLGAQVIEEMGLRGTVVPLEKPISSSGLHLIISKRHWRATTFLYRFNAGLTALKESERYTDIVNKHMSIFWQRLQTNG